MGNTTKQAHDTNTKNRPPAEPDRKRGGQELPDSVQDRPEQNRGYDEAVHGRGTNPPRPDSEERIDLEDEDETDDDNSEGVVKIEGDEEG